MDSFVSYCCSFCLIYLVWLLQIACVIEQNAVSLIMTYSYITISISLKPDVTALIFPVSTLNVDQNKQQIKKVIIYMNNEVEIKERGIAELTLTNSLWINSPFFIWKFGYQAPYRHFTIIGYFGKNTKVQNELL